MKVSFLSRDPDKVFVWIGNNSHYFTFRGPLMSKSIQILEGLACSLPRRSVRSSESALCLIRKYAKTVKQSGMTAWIIQAARVKMCLSSVVNPCVPYLTARRLSIRSMESSTETVLHQSKHRTFFIITNCRGGSKMDKVPTWLNFGKVMACQIRDLTNYLLIKASMNKKISR